MALPTQDDLKKLDYNYFGQPFCWLSLKSTLDTDTLDYQYFGQPFWAVMPSGEEPPPPTGAVRIMPSLSAVALGNAVRISAVRKVGLSG